MEHKDIAKLLILSETVNAYFTVLQNTADDAFLPTLKMPPIYDSIVDNGGFLQRQVQNRIYFYDQIIN